MGYVLAVIMTLAGIGGFTGCAKPTGGLGPSGPSGVSGVTVIDQGCPIIDGSTPCPTQPLRARVGVLQEGSATVVAQTESDTSGRFRIPLEPGHYTLNSQNLDGAAVPVARPLEIEVRDGIYTQVTVHFDSGVRSPTR